MLVAIAFGICTSAHPRQSRAEVTAPAAGAVRVVAASNDHVSLTATERQWLSLHDGHVRIGITVIPPQVLHDSGGKKYQGLAIDYIHLIERKLGCQFQLVPYATWNDVIRAAKSRQIDMIFAAQQTPERLSYLLFTEPYLELPNVILVRKERQGGATLKQMTGWSVAASEGSAAYDYLKNEYGYLHLVAVPDELSGMMKVSVGEVDAMVVEISRASYYIEKTGIVNLRVAGEAGLLYQLRFAVRNDWPILRGILDKGLASVTDDERRDIRRKWILVGGDGIIASRTFWISSATGLGVIALVVTGVVVWNRTLRRIVRQRTSQLQQELAERKKTEEALHRLNRELQALSNCNQVLVRAVDEQVLLQDICRIVCDQAGYRMAWVGYPENDVAKTIRPVAWAGVEEGYLEEAKLTWADTERGHGAAGTAIRIGETACIDDFATTPQAAPWRESALQRGYRACIVLPLKDERENTFGVLTIYSDEPNTFTPDEKRLMEELAGDLAFGIAVLRARIDREQAEAEILRLNADLERRVAERTDDLETKRAELVENQKALEKIVQELNLKTTELENANNELEEETARLHQAMEELREKDRMLLQQSRLAALGEMISNIAHQWRQPLNELGLIVQELPIMYEKGKFDLTYLKASVAKFMKLLSHTSKTIDDFRNFFKPDKETVPFKVQEVVEKSLSLVEESFKQLQIAITVRAAGDLVIEGYPNEFSQVMLNILFNARDAFLARDDDRAREIAIDMFTEGGRSVVTVADNAGGIPEDILDKIFDPYFTTRGPEQGTGIGLYMSKIIIEKNMPGRLSVRNTAQGAEFRIEM